MATRRKPITARRKAALWVGACAVAAAAMSGAGALAATADRPESGPPPAGLEESLREMVADGYPGVVAQAVSGGREWRVAAGVADRRTGERARPGQRFRIASNTKAFVSAVLLQLEGEGRLSLDDSLGAWLPGLVRGHGNDGSAVTVRQLLNHTSGIYDPTTEAAFWDPYLKDRDRDRVITPRQVIARAMRHKPEFAPGAGWSYSNTNYLLAGLVIEAVTHHPAPAEIQRRVLDPLGLDHTSFPVTDPAIHGPHLHGHDLGGEDMTRFSPSYDWTAGAMISTVADLARFDRALFTGRLLRPAQQRELRTTVSFPDAPAYGLGVQRMEVPCGAGRGTAQGEKTSVWETDGGGPGFTSVAMTTDDGARQLVLAANVYDIGAELRGEAPVPRSSGSMKAQAAALCPG